MKLRMVQDWRQGWRWHSTKALLALGLLPSLWLELPEAWRAEIPGSWLRLAALLVMFAGLTGRLTLQKGPGTGR
ncbi:hypothetical protein CIG19_13360 [Enterobacterales bacterium CwR94]|nr:hypothetical protein CIG19_13360 [Enterobacterales bacterium CwR94]